MFWPIVGLKKKIKRLEDEITSLNEQVKELKFSEQSLVELCNKKHEMIIELGNELIGVRKTSVNVVITPVTTTSKAMTLGRHIGRALRGQGSVTGDQNVDRNNR